MAKLLRGSFFGALVIGVAATALLYQFLPILPDQSGLISRYLLGHPLEFAIVALGTVAVVDLALRASNLSSRRSEIQDVDDRLRKRTSLTDWRAIAAETTDAILVRRLRGLSDLRERKAAEILEHDQKLSDRAAEELAAGYAPLTTILWAIPIVGFLGTVMGITIAVANISPDQLEDSLGQVTSGLAVAFDTTALALALSLLLGFATLFVRRSEERLLTLIDDLSDHRLIPEFEGGSTETDASVTMSNATAELLAHQMAQWNEAMDVQRQSFAQSLQSGHQHFVEAWAGMQAEAIENQRLNWEVSSDHMGDAMADWQAKLNTTLEQLSEAVPQVAVAAQRAASQQFEASLKEVREHTRESAESLARVSASVAGRAETTEELISRCEQLATDVAAATAEQNRDWNSIAAKTAALAELQRSIDEQLGKAGIAEQLDETLHQLTAAVHMLTSRARAA